MNQSTASFARTSISRITLSTFALTLIVGACDQVDLDENDDENDDGLFVGDEFDDTDQGLASPDRPFKRNIELGPYATEALCLANKDADCWTECDKNPPKRPGETLVDAVAADKCQKQGTRPAKYFAKCVCHYTKPRTCSPDEVGDVENCEEPVDPTDPFEPL